MAANDKKRKKKSGNQDGARIQIEAQILDVRREEDTPPMEVYAFSRSGRLLDRTEIKDKKEVFLNLPSPEETGNVRVLAGPSLSIEGADLLAELSRINAIERMVRPGVDDKLLIPIDRILWHCWLRFCTVRGTLSKRVNIGETLSELPVCGAEVEIYEVDPIPIIVPKIPDHILERLREVIVGPIPDPDPFLPRPIDPDKFRRFARVEEIEEPELDLRISDAEVSESSRERFFRFAGPEQRMLTRKEATEALRGVMDDPALVRAASSGVPALREALVAHPVIVRPLLCFLWPQAVTTKLIATAKTDDCGRFRAIFYQGCSTDKPDLYFKAYRRIGFWRFPIYTPTPIACHTRWNYVCGTEVKLVTTSPFAKVCPRCPSVIAPSHWVLAMAVGNQSLANLHGTGSGLTTTSENLGLLSTGAPWGGHLRFRFEFDHDLRTDLNVRYYRVRWRKIGSGNPYVDMTETQWRHYLEDEGSGIFSIKPYSLGPNTVGGTPNLFEMPPATPPGWPNSQWVTANAVVDSSSAGFDSVEFAPASEAGLYAIKLELFNSAGSKVNANSLGISYRIPTTTDLTSTIPTEDASSLGLVMGDGSLRFVLSIDNNPCSGSIGPAQLGSQSIEGNECGVLEYESTSSTLSLPFTAAHPNGYATYRFRVVKGLSTVILDSGVVDMPPGEKILTPTVASLLGSCTTAGFAEDLVVWASATNGWRRLAEYDAHPLPRPFVLTSS